MIDHRQNVLIVMSQEAADTSSRIAASMPFETLAKTLERLISPHRCRVQRYLPTTDATRAHNILSTISCGENLRVQKFVSPYLAAWMLRKGTLQGSHAVGAGNGTGRAACHFSKGARIQRLGRIDQWQTSMRCGQWPLSRSASTPGRRRPLTCGQPCFGPVCADYRSAGAYGWG